MRHPMFHLILGRKNIQTTDCYAIIQKLNNYTSFKQLQDFLPCLMKKYFYSKMPTRRTEKKGKNFILLTGPLYFDAVLPVDQ